MATYTTSGDLTYPKTATAGESVTLTYRHDGGGSDWTMVYYICARYTTGGVITSTSGSFDYREDQTITKTFTVPSNIAKFYCFYDDSIFAGADLDKGEDDTSCPCTVTSPPTTPTDISIPSYIEGGDTITISWGASTDANGNLSGYKLYRKASGGSWTLIYTGTATSTTNVVEAGITTVQYRVLAYDSGSNTSSYATSSTITVINNVAPTAPASVALSSDLIGGQACTVTWTAASDDDGNLEGYLVQRSVDGGTTWVQVYQGEALTTSNTIPWGSETVLYRVCAYDTDAAQSSWTVSSETSVFNNNAPTAPATLLLPDVLYGGQANTITWTAGGDADGNLVGYILQFAADSADFATLYTGSALTYTHTPTQGLVSAQYRVCSYDAFDASSGWTTATASEIVNNTPPTITADDYDSGDDLGTVTAAPSVTYQVADEDGDSVTCTYLLDGAAIGTATPDLGDDTVLTWAADDWQQVRNGDHTLQIVADDGTAAGTFALTFTKAVNALAVTLQEALPADGLITVCALSVLGSIPVDAEFAVLVSNDGGTTWEDATSAVQGSTNYVFLNAPTSGHAFSFKVDVSVGESGTGGYITAVQGGFQ